MREAGASAACPVPRPLRGACVFIAGLVVVLRLLFTVFSASGLLASERSLAACGSDFQELSGAKRDGEVRGFGNKSIATRCF